MKIIITKDIDNAFQRVYEDIDEIKDLIKAKAKQEGEDTSKWAKE